MKAISFAYKIQSVSHFLSYLLEQIPADALDRLPIQDEQPFTPTFTHRGNLEYSLDLIRMSLHCGGKQSSRRKPTSAHGEHAHSNPHCTTSPSHYNSRCVWTCMRRSLSVNEWVLSSPNAYKLQVSCLNAMFANASVRSTVGWPKNERRKYTAVEVSSSPELHCHWLSKMPFILACHTLTRGLLNSMTRGMNDRQEAQ